MSYRSIILIIVMLAATRAVVGQFVDIRIDLSTYNEVKIVGESSAETKNGVLLQWLGISMSENIELGIGVKYHELSGNEKRLDIMVLNDNSSVFSGAVPVNGNYIAILICFNSELINKNKDTPRKYTAWIGFPARQISELTLEYN